MKKLQRRRVVSRTISAGFILAIWWTTSSKGQSASEPETAREVPAPPLLKPVAEYSSWSVTYSYEDEREKPGVAIPATVSSPSYFQLRPRKSVFIKTGEIISEKTVNVGGDASETWRLSGIQYHKPPGDAVWLQILPGADGTSNDRYDPLPPSGYADLQWISSESYAGTAQLEGRECLIFLPKEKSQLKLESTTNPAAVLSEQDFVVYIDMESRHPLLMKKGGEIRTFETLPSPSAMQTLPTDLKEQLEKAERGRADLYTPAKRPY